MITAAWEEQRAIKEVMVFLQGVGVSTSLAVRIYKTYQDQAIDVVRREPYRLAGDVWGIGFKTADQIAQRLGIPHDSPQRVKAGLQFALSEASDDGHCYLPETELVTKATGLLGVEAELAGRCLEDLVAEEGVVAEPLPAHLSPGVPEGTGRAFWLVPFHRAEAALAAGLLRLLDAPVDRLASFQAVDWTAALDWLHQTLGVTLAAEQAAAVRLALTDRVAVLTGGPGCGKSYTVRAIVALARAKQAKILLAAPTGRAAKRLGELAGLQAATLHRLLQLRPGGDAAFDRDHPLDADLVVVDETSMLDVLLANKLVKAIPPGAHLLLVGDAGQPPITRGLADFFLFAEDEPDRVADLVVDILANRLPRRFSLDPRRDVQVLCPMHRGPAGAGVLNERLQAAPTPGREGFAERRFGGRVYRVGDKVMQISNNYDKGTAGVFNGSVGVVTALSLEDQELRVRLDEDEEVAYGFDELDELTHAYAVSIHRSQGSEYPCVVVPLTMSAWLMLRRSLLYTAVTRAKRIVVLVGSKRALAKAVRTPGAGRRYTALTERLQPGRTGPGYRRSQLNPASPTASSHSLRVGPPAPAPAGRTSRRTG